ncbi:hypothetical protein ACJ2A9_14550 [Anaerobacillus sp. MEB173]|uniref:hypothetical protein n=1 Tax=Anaerobacillus sp. MEB173 TaxID=3383345 RepID=UPI003F919EBA
MNNFKGVLVAILIFIVMIMIFFWASGFLVKTEDVKEVFVQLTAQEFNNKGCCGSLCLFNSTVQKCGRSKFIE